MKKRYHIGIYPACLTDHSLQDQTVNVDWLVAHKADIAPIVDSPRGLNGCGHTGAAQVIFCDSDGGFFRIRLSANGNAPYPEHHELNSDVYKDGALEFFFAPDAETPTRYFNFELNSDGVLLIGYRDAADLSTKRRIPVDNYRDFFDITPFVIIQQSLGYSCGLTLGWGVSFSIPVSFIREYFPGWSPTPGLELYVNFPKLREVPGHIDEHYLTWGPSDPTTFHCPEFFSHLDLVSV